MIQIISPSLGGGEALFYNFAKSMLEKGHEVHIICYKLRAPSDPSQRRPGVEAQDLIRNGATIHAIKPALEDRGGVLLTYGQQMGYIISALREGLRVIKGNDINIIHANTYTPIIPAVILGKILKVPVISTIHHVTLGQWKLWSSQEGVHGSTSFIGPIYEKFALKMPMDAVHVVSHTTREDFIRLNPKAKATTIYNGIDLSSSPRLVSELKYQGYVLYIGRLAITKNLEVVIRALREVTKDCPHARLIIVGEGGMRNEWQKLVNENGLERNVTFMGHVSPDIKNSLLGSCAALVLPSILEGFGRVIIEAFTMYKPVLVSDIKALKEVVDDGVDGFLIPPDDVSKWAEKIKYLLSDSEICKVMGTNGRKKVAERFDLTLMSNKIEDLYRSAIRSKKSK